MNEETLVAIVEDILTDPEYGGRSWHQIAELIVSAILREIDGDFRHES
jgi:hypothetical protein